MVKDFLYVVENKIFFLNWTEYPQMDDTDMSLGASQLAQFQYPGYWIISGQYLN